MKWNEIVWGNARVDSVFSTMLQFDLYQCHIIRIGSPREQAVLNDNKLIFLKYLCPTNNEKYIIL